MANFTQIDWDKYAAQGMSATFVRTNRIPLDKTEIYYSLDDAKAYAENEKSMAYAGQVISVVDSATNKSTAYVIQMDRTLLAVGTGAGSGSISAATFNDALTIAASAMPGQVIYVMNSDEVDPETGKSAHIAGPYIVNGKNSLDLLAASSVSGDTSLEARVSALETTVSTIKPDVLASASTLDAAVSAATFESAKTYTDDALTAYATSADTVAAIESLSSASTEALKNYATSADTAAADEKVLAAASAETAAQIEALDLANTYAAKSYEEKVDTLVGEDSGKTARDIAIEEVVKVVSGAPEAFDTLKEIADWIDTHQTSAITMANDIETLKASAATLDNKFNDYATSADTAAAIAAATSATTEALKDYATSADTVAAIEAVNGSNIEVGTPLTGDTAYESGETVSTVLQGILDSLSGVKSSGITAISGETITVTKSGSTVGIEVKLEESTSATTAEGHIEIAKNSEGALYGTMYWDGDDTEE